MVVEKVSYEINWRGFKRGCSFFIPCLNHPIAKQEILKVTKRMKLKVLMKVVIEDGIKGVRVWRL